MTTLTDNSTVVASTASTVARSGADGEYTLVRVHEQQGQREFSVVVELTCVSVKPDSEPEPEVFSCLGTRDVGDKEEPCPICLSKIIDKCATLKGCTHVFHKACIEIWIQRRPTCPVCRNPVQTHDEDHMGEVFELLEEHFSNLSTDDHSTINNRLLRGGTLQGGQRTIRFDRNARPGGKRVINIRPYYVHCLSSSTSTSGVREALI